MESTPKSSNIREPCLSSSDSDSDETWLKNSQLFTAIRKGKLDKVKTLLENGIKPDVIDKNNKDNTPLHCAVEKGKHEIVAELLNPKWKTHTNLKNCNGKTPLDIALKKNNQEIVQLLQSYHTEVSVKTNESHVLLDIAKKRFSSGGQGRMKTKRKASAKTSAAANQDETGNLFTYERTDGAAGLEGHLCEINLSILLLLKGTIDEKITSFYLASNIKKADKFDDVAFKYDNIYGRSKIVFVQTKHKTSEKGVNLNSILSSSETGDFSLNKYFISYRKIRRLFAEGKDDPLFGGNFADCQFLLYTNSSFDYGQSKCIKEVENEIDLLRVNNLQAKYFQLEYNSDKKERILGHLKNSSDCRRLAKALADAVSSPHGIDIQKEIFQDYHSALLQSVIETTAHLKGKLRDDFLNADNATSADQFRAVFFEEAAKALNKPMDKIQQELSQREIKLSNKFSDENCTGYSDLPNDDPIHENEVQDFLARFKLYAFQPSEKDLEVMIKETSKTFYKIEQQDVDSVFTDVEYHVKKWWKDENYYLTKGNKFFEDAARVSFQFDVMEPTSSFTGRIQEMANLHRILNETRNSGKKSRMASITGLGGVGKTEFVRKYLSKHKSDYDHNVIWINAENNLSIMQSFRRLAGDQLGVSIYDENGKEKNTQLLAEDVYGFFAKRHRKSLFVFDNAEKHRIVGEGQGIDKFLPKSDPNKPYVLITSRHQEWREITNLPLDVLTEEECVEFQRKALKDIVTVGEVEARKLGKELGYLPLALRQATAYISVENQGSDKWSKEKFTISSYLKQFEEQAVKLLRSPSYQKHNSVLTTWKMSLDKIKQKKLQGGELAIFMLYIMSYVAADNIPVDELFSHVIEDVEVSHSAIDLLDQYSMAYLHRGNVSLHRLVQKVARIELEEQGRNEEFITHTFGLLEKFSEKLEAFSERRRILPHLEAFLTHIDDWLNKKPEDGLKIETEFLQKLLSWMKRGYHLIDTERYKQLLERLLVLNERYFAPDHYEVTSTLVNLGEAYGDLGDPKKQIELLERALDTMENRYGPDDIHVAIHLPNLGSAYGALGDVQKHIELVERGLAVEERYYGIDSVQLTPLFKMLGALHVTLGDFEKEKELLERALVIEEKTCGPDDFQLSITLANLANIHGTSGDFQKQIELLERSIAIKEKNFGPDHYMVALGLASLGNAYADLGDTLKQKDLLERALEKIEKLFGPDHFKGATTLSSLGNAYGALGNTTKQIELQERALTILENQFGTEAFQSAVPLFCLGNAYSVEGNPQKAKNFLERALAKQERYHGPDHIAVAATLVVLSNVYADLGNDAKQQQLLEQALPILEKYNHPTVTEIKTVLDTVRDKLFYEREQQNTILHKAVKSNNEKILVDFLNTIMGNDSENFSQHLNAVDSEGNTALMCAVHDGLGSIAKILIEKSANLNVQNEKGQTALHLATEGSFEEIVILLLKANADSTLKDKNEQTPFDLAQIKLSRDLSSSNKLFISVLLLLNVNDLSQYQGYLGEMTDS